MLVRFHPFIQTNLFGIIGIKVTRVHYGCGIKILSASNPSTLYGSVANSVGPISVSFRSSAVLAVVTVNDLVVASAVTPVTATTLPSTAFVATHAAAAASTVL